MESMREILRRITTNARTRTEQNASSGLPTLPAGQLPEESSSPKCQVCNGTEWVSKHVEVGHPEFGKMFPCECVQPAPERLQGYSELPFPDAPHNWSNFTPRPDVTGLANALQAAQDFAGGNTENNVLTLCGSNGLGKSHLLEAIGWDMLAQGYRVKFAGVSDLVDKLRATFSNDDPAKRNIIKEGCEKPDVLLLDDLKIERVTDFGREAISRLVDLRYQYGGYLVVTTKFSADEIGDKWTSHLADRLFDENSGVVRVFYLSGASYRTGRRWQ